MSEINTEADTGEIDLKQAETNLAIEIDQAENLSMEAPTLDFEEPSSPATMVTSKFSGHSLANKKPAASGDAMVYAEIAGSMLGIPALVTAAAFAADLFSSKAKKTTEIFTKFGAFDIRQDSRKENQKPDAKGKKSGKRLKSGASLAARSANDDFAGAMNITSSSLGSPANGITASAIATDPETKKKKEQLLAIRRRRENGAQIIAGAPVQRVDATNEMKRGNDEVIRVVMREAPKAAQNFAPKPPTSQAGS